MIICPVCKNELIKIDKSYKCINNHLFYISKNGYVNLILSNKKMSKNPGDNKEMVKSRHDFLKTEKYHKLKEELYNIISKYNHDLFIDVACGEGYYTNFLSKLFKKSIGIDISKEAIIQALKEKSEVKYLIASMYNLPIQDNCVDVLLNCFAPMCIEEFKRVLKNDGIFIRVIPNEYHLYELKKVLYPNTYINQVFDPKLEGFDLLDTIYVDDEIELNNSEINDLFKMTPYYYRSPIETSNNLKQLNYLKTRISFIIYVYKTA